jgi:O-antigen/teichoic acid export membrane protein
MSTVVVFVCSFLKNKLLAVVLGVAGVGIVSQLSNFVSFLNYFVPLGIPNGLSKVVAEEQVNENEKLRYYLESSLNMVLYPTILFSTVIFFFSNSVSIFLLETEEYSGYIKIISLSIPFIVLNSILEGFLRGLKQIKLYVKLIIVTNLVNLFFIIPAVLLFGVTGGVYGIISSYLIYVIYSFNSLRKEGLLKGIRFFRSIDKTLFNKLVKVSFALLVSGAMFQLTLLILRKIIIADFGVFYNGIFQSVIGISINYFGFIFLSLSTYSFPTVSKLLLNKDINDELNTNVRYIVSLMVPLIIILFIFRSLVVSILFTSEFLPAEVLFAPQFMGDFFKALSWSIGIWLVPKMKLKEFLVLEVILNFNLIFFFWIMLNFWGNNLYFVSLSYFIAFTIHAFLNYVVARKSLNFSFGSKNRRLLILSLLFLIPVIVISQFYVNIGYWLILPILASWLFLVVDKREFEQLKCLLISTKNIQ